MAKGFKLKFNIPLFQMCRSKDPSAFPGNPVVPAIYRLSPVNPKEHDVGYPSSLLVPPPPPSSPEHRGSKVTSRIMSLRQMCRDDHRDKQVNTRGRRSTSSVPSRRSNVAVDNEEESESLISCTTSFSDDSYSLKPERDLVSSSSGSRRHMRRISSVKKVQRMRFNTARLELPETEQVKKTKTKTKTKVVSTASTTRMRRSSAEGKVRESFAVVKKSKDPYEDFKRSMVEMIREMEMRDAEDLQQLLQCFLALNSRCYHDVIVRAFMEIWQEMFVMKPASSNTNDILQRDQLQLGE
ncbi:hypothetical protein HN51_052161 [Arachis hypogaea]|uniref:Transcription repressor n=1 Tax=Arachis hypogaea TaxID=3818 RepID=A0A445CC73_ARAHY|nr:transcription repressor OFP7-like [Arachis ipaensis]XP_025668218.1 transcription repressor OFP7-like [Arachis hypogaea]QHN93446.1 Transcription repressor [Arachis hypogaea]RYR48421.1 hypothetical protein Ahy_A07g034445 isoform B [Arachis hypogaea]